MNKLLTLLLPAFCLLLTFSSCEEIIDIAVDDKATYTTLSIESAPLTVASMVERTYPNYYTSVVFVKSQYHCDSYIAILRPNKEHQINEAIEVKFDEEGDYQSTTTISAPDIAPCLEYPIQLRLRHETTFRTCSDYTNLTALRAQSQDYGFVYQYPLYHKVHLQRQRISNFSDLKAAYRTLDCSIYTDDE